MQRHWSMLSSHTGLIIIMLFLSFWSFQKDYLSTTAVTKLSCMSADEDQKESWYYYSFKISFQIILLVLKTLNGVSPKIFIGFALYMNLLGPLGPQELVFYLFQKLGLKHTEKHHLATVVLVCGTAFLRAAGRADISKSKLKTCLFSKAFNSIWMRRILFIFTISYPTFSLA